MTRASQHVRIACAFLGISLLFYWKTLLTHQFSFLTGFEGVNQAYSWYQFIISSLRNGSLPVWDPFTFSGRSFLGETQTGAFYPANFLLTLIPFNVNHLFSPAAYHVYVAATHALAGYLMFRLVRELGLGVFAGFVAGIVFSFSGMLQHAGWPHLLQSGIWLPAIFELLLRAWRESRLARSLVLAAIGGLCMGMTILAGGVHFVIMDALVIVTAAGYLCAVDRDVNRAVNQKAWRKIAAIALVALTVGVAFSAIQLLPSMEYAQLANRYSGSAGGVLASARLPYAYLESDHLWPHSFLTLLFPTGFNGNAGEGETLNFYIGVFPILLAMLGLWSARNSRWPRYFAGLALAAFLYSLGSFSPLHGIAYALVPGIWVAREASRFMYLAGFALVALSAFGAEAMFAGALDAAAWKKPTRVVNGAGGITGVIFLVSAIFGLPQLSPWMSMSLFLILLSALLYRYVVSGHAGTGAKLVAVGLIFFDLNVFDLSAGNKIDLGKAKQTDQLDRLLSLEGAVGFLKSRPGPFRVDLPFDNAPNIGDAYGIESTFGAGVTIVQDYDRIRGRQDLLNAKYAVKPASVADPGPIWQDSAWKIYENAAAYPRAWMVHQVELEHTPSALQQALYERPLDLHGIALLGEPLTEVVEPAADSGSEHVDFNHYDPAAPEIAVHASSRALLVLSENYYPGWKATLNGKPANIVKVDGGLRGVVVPAGDSRVSMRYRPASVIVGGILTLSTLLAVALGWFLVRRPRALP